MKFTIATQNLSHNGWPPEADIVATQESNWGHVTRSLSGHHHLLSRSNKNLSVSWRQKVFEDFGHSVVELHPSGRRLRPRVVGFTPRRDLLIAKGYVSGVKVAVINTHFINSAWAPRWKPTWLRKRRRRLWRRSYAVLCERIESFHKRGFVVVALGDFNRLGKWCPLGMRDVRPRGLDRIFVSDDPRVRVLRTWKGPSTGTGRVTHGSVHAELEIDWRMAR